MRTKSVMSAVLAALGLLAVLVIPSAAGAEGDHRQTGNTVPVYTITFENLTHGQYFTPPNYALHNRHADVFSRGEEASNGVRQVAENGAVPVLAEELAAAIDANGLGVSGVGFTEGVEPGPIGPGEAVTFEVTSPERRLSIVSMIVCTNDGFAGLDGRRLPHYDGGTEVYFLRGYDAGTEVNTEARGDIVPAPFCGEGDGTDMSNPDLAENGVIRNHRGIQGTGDLDPDIFDWNNPVVKVTVTRTDVPVDVRYEVTFENLTHGQYFTPPNFALHNPYADVFDRGEEASNGVRQVAENGAVPVLAEELAAAIDANGLGVSGVGFTEGVEPGPIGPGEAVTFEITGSERHLSIVSMIVCTNDGFAGLDGRRVPGRDGQTRTYYLRGYDAGTEVNTEARGDIVPAPFCGEGDGTDMSNPDLAENGVIRNHRGIRGTGDLDPDIFDWNGPVVRVTVTRIG